jgi:hypothetical protein
LHDPADSEGEEMSQHQKSKQKRKPWLATHGDPAFRRAAGLIDEEFHKDLKGKKARAKYREMGDNSAILGTALWLTEALLRQVNWTTEKNESGHPLAEEACNHVDEAFNDMESKWQAVIATFASAMQFGWADVEPTFKIRKGRQREPLLNSKHNDGKIGWRDWAPRPQESLDRWVFDKNGRVLGWWQRPPHSQRTLWLPADRLLRFRLRNKKNNPEGYSLLRVPYVSYFYATRITEVEAIGIERQTAGMPKMEVPPQLLDDAATDDEKTALAEWKDFVQKVRTDSQYGAVVPAEETPDGKKTGFRFSLVAASGKGEASADPVIKRHESRMAMSFFVQFLLLGQDKHGSYALSSDMTHNLSVALGTFLECIAEICNDDAIPQLCHLNGYPPEAYPTRKPGDIEKQSIVEAGQFVAGMLGSGGMQPSEELNDWAYRMIGEEPPEQPDVSTIAAEPDLTDADPDIPLEQDDEPELPPSMDADELAHLIGVSPNVVKNAIKRGQIPGQKVGNRFVMLRENVMRWLEGGGGGNGATL